MESPDADVEQPDGTSVVSLLLNLGGLALIGAVLLWLLGGGPNPPAPFPAREGGVLINQRLPISPTVTANDMHPAIVRQDAASVPGGGIGASSPPPLMQPDDPAMPDREPVAGLPGALERFGEAFPIRHPTYLPADVLPFTVNWQPAADPAARARGHGELLTWFYSAEHGAVLVLAQGPAAGVWPLTAGDDRAGRLRLADGSEAIWVVGHPVRVTADPSGAVAWEGTEITLGVPGVDGDGWYLCSPIISLAEMIRIADSLRETR